MFITAVQFEYKPEHRDTFWSNFPTSNLMKSHSVTLKLFCAYMQVGGWALGKDVNLLKGEHLYNDLIAMLVSSSNYFSYYSCFNKIN